MLPPELEGVLDNLLDQLEGLLDLGLSQRSEVHHPHIHLRTPRGDDTHTHNSVRVREHIQELLPLQRRENGNIRMRVGRGGGRDAAR